MLDLVAKFIRRISVAAGCLEAVRKKETLFTGLMSLQLEKERRRLYQTQASTLPTTVVLSESDFLCVTWTV